MRSLTSEYESISVSYNDYNYGKPNLETPLGIV